MSTTKNTRLEKNEIKIKKRNDIAELTFDFLTDYLSKEQTIIDIVTLPGATFIYENKLKEIAELFPDKKFQLRCYENNTDIYRDSVVNFKEILPGFECVERHSTFSIFKSGNLTITYFRSDFTVVPTDDIIWFDCCGGWAKKVLNPFFDEVNNTEKTNRLIFVTASPLVRNYKTCHEFLVKEDRLFFDREDAFRDMYESEIKGDKTKILDYSYYGGESESEEEEGNLHCPMICVGFHTIKDSKLSLRQHIGKNKQLTSYKQYVS